MTQNRTLDLTRAIFQLLKQLPRIKFKQSDGLTHSEQQLLVLLLMNTDKSQRSLTVTGISNLLQITPAGVTHMLNALEASGHIERLHDPTDRRIVRICLTKDGTQEAEALILFVQGKLTEMVDLLGEEDSKTFIRLLSRVIEHFSE